MKVTQPRDGGSRNVARRGKNLVVGAMQIPEDEARVLAGDMLSALGTCDYEIYDHPRTDEAAEQERANNKAARRRMQEKAEEYAQHWSDDEVVQDLLRQAFLHGVAQAPRSPSNRLGFQRWER